VGRDAVDGQARWPAGPLVTRQFGHWLIYVNTQAFFREKNKQLILKPVAE